MLNETNVPEDGKWNEKKEEEHEKYKQELAKEQAEKLGHELKEKPYVANPELDDTK